MARDWGRLDGGEKERSEALFREVMRDIATGGDVAERGRNFVKREAEDSAIYLTIFPSC